MHWVVIFDQWTSIYYLLWSWWFKNKFKEIGFILNNWSFKKGLLTLLNLKKTRQRLGTVGQGCWPGPAPRKNRLPRPGPQKVSLAPQKLTKPAGRNGAKLTVNSKMKIWYPFSICPNTEAEKSSWRVGIANRKVFARLESFCMIL